MVSSTEDILLHWKISLVFIDILLESTIVISDINFIYDEFIEILEVIVEFAKVELSMPATIVLTLFLRKIKRVFEIA